VGRVFETLFKDMYEKNWIGCLFAPSHQNKQAIPGRIVTSEKKLTLVKQLSFRC